MKVFITGETEAMLAMNQRPEETIHQTANRLFSSESVSRQICPDGFVWRGRLTVTERADELELRSGDKVWSCPFLGEIH